MHSLSRLSSLALNLWAYFVCGYKDDTQTVINQGYNGRMNGVRSGKSQPGRVVFTLTNIKMKDIELYLYMLRAAFGDSNQYDDLKLAFKGNCRF